MMDEDEGPKPDYSEDGVDLSLIRWMLSLTPAERLQYLDEYVYAVETICEMYADPAKLK
jgi:hypothetical protein